MEKVFLTEKIHPSAVKLLESNHVAVVMNNNVDTIASQVEDAKVIITRLERITPEIINATMQLKAIIRHGVGIDNIDLSAATSKGIIVCSVLGANTISVVEHVLTTIGILSKQILFYDHAIRNSGYRDARSKIIGSDLQDKVLGLIGLGRIGTQIALRSKSAFGMKVIAYDPYVREEIDGITITKEIDKVLREADYLTLHVPLMDSTRGLIGKSELRNMKSNAYLINTSRGEVVKEEDLIEALASNVIAGAALDVFNTEPLPDNHPFTKMRNVILTPHIAGVTEDSIKRLSIESANIAIDVLNDRKPQGIANPEVLAKKE